MKMLYLFPDTNVFVQCRDLHELDWSEYGEHGEVRLIVCRAVQREIERHKGRGNDRLGRRSRKVHSMFREIIVSDKAYKIVRESEPVVKLMFKPSCQPDPALAEHLDYTQTDDQIVGCVHSYREKNPPLDIRLLTHDSGPMASAQMLSIPFVSVPNGWLRPPELNDTERENNRLREEIAQLKDAEPRFSISAAASDGEEIDQLEFEWPSFERLSADEVRSLVESLKRRFPIATEFGPRQRKEEQPGEVGAILFNITRRFEPSSQQEIDEYAKSTYPEWLEGCEQTLRHLHAALEHNQKPVGFSFSATNKGSYPGKHVLVTITASGNFLVRPPRDSDDMDEETDSESSAQELSLPSPPRPPEERWTTGYERLFGAIGSLSDPLDLVSAPLIDTPMLRRDPNEFYYKPSRSRLPSQSFSLECEQWRHGMAAETFAGEVWVKPGTSVVRGALELEIHAENLRKRTKRIVQVRGQMKRFDVNAFAQNMIRKVS